MTSLLLESAMQGTAGHIHYAANSLNVELFLGNFLR